MGDRNRDGKTEEADRRGAEETEREASQHVCV